MGVMAGVGWYKAVERDERPERRIIL